MTGYLARLRHPFRRHPQNLSAGRRLLDFVRNRIPGRGPALHPFDLEFGVETSGMIPADRLATGHIHDRHNTAYYAIAPSLFRRLCELWLSGPLPATLPSYTFIDVGAGKGRAVLLAAEFAFREVLGVELNPDLARKARRNLKRWKTTGRPVSPMRILSSDAIEFDFPPGPCVLYLFHPFDGAVLARLLNRIEEAFASRAGELDLLYVNAEFQSLLEDHPGFTRLWQRSIPMSPVDAAFDRVIVSKETGEQYGVTGDETCSAWRWTGTSSHT
jgi:SAM-dependent methyltransferase